MTVDRVRLWLVVPHRESGRKSSRQPVAFSSCERMANWLSTQAGEDCWHVRVFDAAALESVLAELLEQGYTQIVLDDDTTTTFGDVAAQKLPSN